jgi:dolichol-phosphate mannosyltransferase
MEEKNKLISVVVPMYNETETAGLFFETAQKTIKAVCAEKQHISFEFIAVNDGSTDDTLDKLLSLQKVYGNIYIVSLSRNFGQEPAVFAGLSKAKGDAVIVMDCDLQDPPEFIGQMVDLWEKGYDVVNARRVSRASDTKIKRDTAQIYYNILNKLSHRIKYPENVNNFRLVDRRVLDIILNMPEKNKFYRGLVPFAGFKSVDIEIDRKKRVLGKSKYNFKAMLSLAINGVASTSIKPLYWASVIGAVFMLLGILGSVAALVLAAFGIRFNAIIALLFCAMSFFCGISLFFTGINGIYIGKCYEEIKGRPFYIIDKFILPEENNKNGN